MTAIAANADGTVTSTFATASGAVPVVADQVILTTPFAGAAHARLLEGAASTPSRTTAITQLGRGPQRQAAAAVREPLLELERPVGDLERRLLHRPGLPEHLGRRPARRPARPGSWSTTAAATSPARSRRRRRTRTPTQNPQVADLRHARSCDSSRPSSPGIATAWNGKATLSAPFLRPEPAVLVLLLEGRAVHDLRRLRGRPAGQRSTLPASTARRTSRATWRAPRPRGSGRRSRSSTR